ncbi:hypothetical protein B0H66DRAFT_45729 [Apodospora peruviana]|uniref:Ubiquitin-protein ligase sel1 n=1 Tax=Apodospora peruviana TaxID=516989 RepID=A0AAE0IRX2_9PEZI|nr:hypothetical protein B0H66DRAFT_45729 [Apodospora peruviana]
MGRMHAAANAIVATLVPRQDDRDDRTCLRDDDGFIDEDSCYVPFWYTRTGVIVKWSLFLGLTTILGLYLFLGYMHAKKRMAKGLPPLAYHRWLVSRRALSRVDPRYQFPAPGNVYHYDPNNQQAYGMHAMPPPPVYDPTAPRPPIYEGPPAPAGATKIDPSQSMPSPAYTPQQPQRQQDEYEAPPGPPPSQQSTIPAQNPGSTNPFRG